MKKLIEFFLKLFGFIKEDKHNEEETRMTKITINPITGSYGSVVALNDRFQQIEDELNNKVFYRDNPEGGINQMENTLDMNGYAILNASAINIDIDGESVADGVGYAKEWANKAEDSLVSALAGGDEIDDYSALHHAAKASADVVLTNADVVATAADVVLTNNKYDEFDDRYLGSFTTAAEPTVDNDGDALLEGAMYWNETIKVLRVYNATGSVWVTVNPSNTAANINIVDAAAKYSSGDVEGALQELHPQSADTGTIVGNLMTVGGKYKYIGLPRMGQMGFYTSSKTTTDVRQTIIPANAEEDQQIIRISPLRVTASSLLGLRIGAVSSSSSLPSGSYKWRLHQTDTATTVDVNSIGSTGDYIPLVSSVVDINDYIYGEIRFDNYRNGSTVGCLIHIDLKVYNIVTNQMKHLTITATADNSINLGSWKIVPIGGSYIDTTNTKIYEGYLPVPNA